MSKWYRKVTDNIDHVVDAFDYFESEYEIARNEIPFDGRIESLAQRISGVVQHRTAQLYEIEAIMQYLDLQRTKIMTERIKHYTEHYPRSLSEHAARRYAEGDKEVIAMSELRLHMCVVRDKFVSLTKGWEYMHFQLTNVTKLRVAGLEDSII